MARLPNALVTPSSEIFRARIQNQKIVRVWRRAKYIMIDLESDTLIVHLKMTGRLYVVPNDAEHYADKWVHFSFQLGNKHQLRFSDSRKFGRVYLVEDVDSVIGELGPEPLEDVFTLELFQGLIAKRSGKIKPLLLNQHFVAGIGNIYADEALHFAKIHPNRTADSLTTKEIALLWEGIRLVLTKGVQNEGASVNWYRKPDGSKGKAQVNLTAYGQEGKICQTCGIGVIEKIIVAQRGTHFCPNCQRET